MCFSLSREITSNWRHMRFQEAEQLQFSPQICFEGPGIVTIKSRTVIFNIQGNHNSVPKYVISKSLAPWVKADDTWRQRSPLAAPDAETDNSWSWRYDPVLCATPRTSAHQSRRLAPGPWDASPKKTVLKINCLDWF